MVMVLKESVRKLRSVRRSPIKAGNEVEAWSRGWTECNQWQPKVMPSLSITHFRPEPTFVRRAIGSSLLTAPGTFPSLLLRAYRGQRKDVHRSGRGSDGRGL